MYHKNAQPVQPLAPAQAAADGAATLLGRAQALSRFPTLDPQVWDRVSARFPVRVTQSWVERVRAVDDPLGLQVFPHPSELQSDPGDLPDPVGERDHSPVPFVVRKHDDRVLLQVTRRCHLHCRFCFRRDQGGGEPSVQELARALDYVRGSGARELIVSGGDPLVLADAKLWAVLDAVRPDIPVVRIHTRAPIAAPARVSPALVRGLRQRAPLWVVVHTNHARELSPPVRAALGRLVDGGLPVLAQTVLLQGVNADATTLGRLFETLLELRVQPYTLHHTDRVPGNARFRVSIPDGLQIYEALRRRLGGVALPRYVIDRPDGSGKVPVAEHARAHASDAGGASSAAGGG